ncbi:hypothetical protein LEP1GSC099_4176 [Leptospira interrogans str. UI 08452]|nr:hypothetical protein LEP1GSC099_4176 [Leptospira interrogans str. UI 08452]
MYFLEIINRNVSSKNKYLGLKIEFAFENNQSLNHKMDSLNFYF